MKTVVVLPEGFDNYLKIQNARERFEEAEDVSRKLLDGGIALKANADHYAMFCDPPRLLAGPLKQVGYVVGADNRCYPSPVDGCDYINVAASLPVSSPAREKGWPDHIAIVHPVDDLGAHNPASHPEIVLRLACAAIGASTLKRARCSNQDRRTVADASRPTTRQERSRRAPGRAPLPVMAARNLASQALPQRAAQKR